MRVKWTGDALDRLADIYVTAAMADRDTIEAGVERINAALATDPRELGESRSGNRRVWFARPLVVTFQIEPDDELAIVFKVARLR